MSALLLRQITRMLVPLALLFGLALLMKGHDEPGGGFVAGLAFAIAAVLALAAWGSRTLREYLWPGAETCVLLGGLLLTLTVVVPAFFGGPLLQHGSVSFELPWLGKNKLHSALLFDIGVLLVVAGAVASVATLLGRSEESSSAEEED